LELWTDPLKYEMALRKTG